MVNMFCVSCGKKATIESLCEDCFTKEKQLFLTQDSELKVCGDCGAYFDKKWQDPKPFDEMIDFYIKDRIVKLGTIKSIKVQLKHVGNVVVATIEATGVMPPAKKLKSATKTMRIRVRDIKCDNCVKIRGGYYEGLIQVRGNDAERILKKIHADRIEKVRDGYDIRFTKKGDAARIAKDLQKHFSVVSSFKFVTEKKGKKLYRNFYAIR